MPEEKKYPQMSFQGVKYFLNGEPTAVIEWTMQVDYRPSFKGFSFGYIRRYKKDENGNKILAENKRSCIVEFITCGVHNMTIKHGVLEIHFTTVEE